MSEQVGAALRRCRVVAGYETQAEVAELLGRTQTSLSYWESGKRSPRPEDLITLANLYGCTVDALLGYQPKRWLIRNHPKTGAMVQGPETENVWVVPA